MRANASLLDRFEINLQKKTNIDKIFLLNDHGLIKQKINYSNLQSSARDLSIFLQQNRLDNERVLLLFPSSIDFLLSKLGCFYAKTICVPLNIPDNKNIDRLKQVVASCQPKGILTNIDTINALQEIMGNWPAFALEKAITIDRIVYVPIRDQEISNKITLPDNVAFIQYTSGSTFLPKGVIVTHANLIYNLEYIKNSFSLSEHDISLTWLPNYHDMGLIDGLLLPIYLGCDSYIMSPRSLLKNPLIWLKSISNYKATHSGGPNFSYDMCIRRIKEDDKKNLNLSSWKSAYNGAEPIMQETIDKFSEYFATVGFKKESIYPCYGLAETTLMVTGCNITRAPVVKFVDNNSLLCGRIEINHNKLTSNGQFLVSSGIARMETVVIVVDPESKKELDINVIGEIWVGGPTVATGYLNNSEETEKTFNQFTSDYGKGPFLRTGDLGFLDEGGELFITGRIKDLIIINGENYYPQDIEYIAEKALSSNKPHIAVAFDLKIQGSNSSQIFLILQVKNNFDSNFQFDVFCKKIAEQIYHEQNIIINFIVLTTQPIPKTTSGKVQRQSCKKMYLDGSLQKLYVWENKIFNINDRSKEKLQRKIENHLVMWLANNFGVEFEKIDKDAEFYTFYLDSIKIAEMFSSIEKNFNLNVPIELVYSYPSIKELASYLSEEVNLNFNEPKSCAKQSDNNNLKLSFIPDFEI